MKIISTNQAADLAQYILMERIIPPPKARFQATLISEGITEDEELCTSELGIFSSFIRLAFLNNPIAMLAT